LQNIKTVDMVAKYFYKVDVVAKYFTK